MDQIDLAIAVVVYASDGDGSQRSARLLRDGRVLIVYVATRVSIEVDIRRVRRARDAEPCARTALGQVPVGVAIGRYECPDVVAVLGRKLVYPLSREGDRIARRAVAPVIMNDD